MAVFITLFVSIGDVTFCLVLDPVGPSCYLEPA